MNFDWSRFKNYGLWVSILALIPMILSTFGVHIVPEEYQTITNTILSILVALGIVNNPTTQAKWFNDDKRIGK
ncbi:phage holin [Clostridium tertium]|uniref:phage holin n=1 Tax=Clostridium tertium TaxID=1559 RepID=UPI0023B2944E|nr:phage holin [Clostridium tertium]